MMNESLSGKPAQQAQPVRVLLVEDVLDDAELCLAELRRAGFEVQADYRLPNWTGMEAFERLQALEKDIPFILVTGALGEQAAVDCLKQGITDYVLKDALVHLPTAVRRALEEKALRDERARAKAALEESENRLRTMIETEPECVKVVAADGTLLEINAAGLAMVEADSAAQVIGKPVYPLIAPEYREAFCTLIETVYQGNKGALEFEVVGLKGTRRWMETRAAPLRHPADGSVSLLAVTRDITERRQAEEALQEANERLQRWVKELKQRTHELTLINEMGDLLQTCLTPEEIYAVVSLSARKLYAGESGALYVHNGARNLVETVAVWGEHPSGTEVFPPEECWALRRGRPHLAEDSSGGPFCQHVNQGLVGRSLCIPMLAQGEALGVFCVLRVAPEHRPSSGWGESLAEADLNLAVTFAEHIALALANLKLRETMRLQSFRDPLTGLFNRRYMEESLDRELRRAMRKQRSVGAIMMDLDHFKRINDTFGHQAGDKILRALGQFLRSNVRAEDIACRYGGEEFMLVLPEATLDVTLQRAQRLREGFKHLNVRHQGGSLEAVTLSLGVAAFPDHGMTAEAILHAADRAFYQAKAEGRDRVVVGQAVEEEAFASKGPAPPGRPPAGTDQTDEVTPSLRDFTGMQGAANGPAK